MPSAVLVKKAYEMYLLSKGASFVAADPDTNTLIVGVENPEVKEIAEKIAKKEGIKVKFVEGGLVAWGKFR